MHRFYHLTRSVPVLLILILAADPARAQEPPQHEVHNPDVVIERPDVVMHVTGLVCDMCARSVTNTLKKVDAVKEVQVLLEDDQRILLTLKEGAEVDETTLREAVTSAGFSTRKVVFNPVQGPSS